MKRLFECSEGGSSKFWEVTVEGATLTVRFGRLGTPGQTKVKTLPSDQAAASEAAKLVAEKTKKGYVEAHDGAATPAPRPAEDGAALAAPQKATPPRAETKASAVPAGPAFPTIYTEHGNVPVTWTAARSTLRRRIDPDHGNVVAALMRGWRAQVTSREEAESLLARVLALPGEPPTEPAAVFAWPGWEVASDQPRWVVFGAILVARCSDTGPDRQLWLAQGPAAIAIETLDARVAWADDWIAAAFRSSFPEAVGDPATFLVTGGAMGDAYLALGATRSRATELPFSRRTFDSYGTKHPDGISGVRLAHASWDEGTCVPVDLSPTALAAARAELGKKIRDPQIVIAATYDSRS